MGSPTEFDVAPDFIDQTVIAVTSAWLVETARVPWLQLSDAERLDHVPSFLRHLLGQLFQRSAAPVDGALMLMAAAQHGEQRHNLEFDEETILHEYYVLRQILWDHFRETFGELGAELLIVRA